MCNFYRKNEFALERGKDWDVWIKEVVIKWNIY